MAAADNAAAQELARLRERISRLDQTAREMEAGMAEPQSLRALRRLPADTPSSEVVRALADDGAVIVERLVSEDTADRVATELRPYIDATLHGMGFAGSTTKRTGAVAARSETSWQLLGHPLLKEVCDEVLGRQRLPGKKVSAKNWHSDDARYSWIINLTQAIQIGPGSTPQPIHQDDGFAIHDFYGEVEVEISTMWALDEFTEENGATRVVPGSHKPGMGPRKKAFALEDSTHAAMPKGSVLVWLGTVFHGGGKNQSNKTRLGLNVDYCVGFLRQEENQYLACPPQEARRLPKDMQNMLGYQMGGFALGYVADNLPPYAQLTPGVDLMVPGSGNEHSPFAPKHDKAQRTTNYRAKL